MKFLKVTFFAFLFSAFTAIGANAAVNAECQSLTDCDELVACELVYEIENALAGLPADYNRAAANAVSYRNACKNYPNEFKGDINQVISENPKITLKIEWATVKRLMLGGPDNGLTAEDLKAVEHIVNVFGPDTEGQRKFFEALATAYVKADKADPNVTLDDAFVLNFLGEEDNFAKYRFIVRDLTGETKDTELGIDVSWDDVLVEISSVLDKVEQKKGALVCENNRSYQVGIEVIGWVATAVAAVATFYAGGAGGAGVAAGRAALGVGLKAAAKGVAKVGGKAAAKSISKAGSKQLAKSAVKQGLKANMRGWANYAGKGVLKSGVKNFTKAVGVNLGKKKTKLAVAGALIYQFGSVAGANSGVKTFYSLVESGLDKDIVNCQDLDKNEGCYTVCGYGNGDDDLNTKALNPVLGKNYCVSEQDYALYEITPQGTQGTLLIFDGDKWGKISRLIKTKVQDQGKCDWNEDDIDMYVGFFMYDPDTLEISDKDMIIDDYIRLDD